MGEIYGVGCDIVNIQRIERCISRFQNTFLYRVFTAKEIVCAPSPSSRIYYPYWAKRYAAKEACSKALGSGIGQSIGFQEIEVLNNASGAPFIKIHKDKYALLTTHLSLSDDYPFAMAYVILEKGKKIHTTKA